MPSAAEEMRERCRSLLRAAGPAGMARSEVQAAIGAEEKTTSYYLHTPGLAIKGQTRAHEFTRWFAPEFADAAAAYVAARDAIVKDNKTARFSESLLDAACVAAVDGRTHEQIAEALGRNLRTVADVMLRLARAGRVQRMFWPIGGGVNGLMARYWALGAELPPLPEKEPSVRVRKSNAKPKHLHQKPGPKPGLISKKSLSTRRRALSPDALREAVQEKRIVSFALAQPIVPPGVKVTICPAGKDHRFSVSQPEPFFSREGYKPAFIGHDTWAAKVYGGNV